MKFKKLFLPLLVMSFFLTGCTDKEISLPNKSSSQESSQISESLSESSNSSSCSESNSSSSSKGSTSNGGHIELPFI